MILLYSISKPVADIVTANLSLSFNFSLESYSGRSMRLKQVLEYDDGKSEGKKKMKRTRKKMKEIFGERDDIFSVEQFEIIIVISTKVYRRFNSTKLLLFHSIQ